MNNTLFGYINVPRKCLIARVVNGDISSAFFAIYKLMKIVSVQDYVVSNMIGKPKCKYIHKIHLKHIIHRICTKFNDKG